MAKILLGWELGGDYGHLACLISVARALRERGHVPVFMIRELMGAQKLLGPHGFPWYQAPLWLGRVTNLPPPVGYAEMLMRFGYLEPGALEGICRAWRNQIELLRPDLLVLEHAPTALLASRGLGLPRVQLGTGFTVPPASVPLPPFNWWSSARPERLEDSEQHALATANAVLKSLGEPAMAQLAGLFDTQARLLCSVPELDHYGSREQGEFVGPIYSIGQGAPATWPSGGGARIFAYVKPGYAGFEQVLQALRESGASVLVHAPGAAKKTLERFGSPAMRFSEQPVDIEGVRRECDLALCHAGAGTTAALLLAGKPLVLLPTQVEQVMVSYRAQQLGAALVVMPEAVARVGEAIAQALASPGLTEAARQFAARYSGYAPDAAVARVAERCETLLSGRH